MFKARNNGFWITFPSGIILSTQFSYGNYCEGHEKFLEACQNNTYDKARMEGCKDAEIAIGTENEPCCLTAKACNEALGREVDDNVEGHVSLDEWLKLLDWCRKESNV